MRRPGVSREPLAGHIEQVQAAAIELEADAIAGLELDESRESRDQRLPAHRQVHQRLRPQWLHYHDLGVAHPLVLAAQADVLGPHAEMDLPLVMLERHRHRQAAAVHRTAPFPHSSARPARTFHPGLPMKRPTKTSPLRWYNSA